MASGPLFILSGPRSGSTLLRYILDTHSEIASPGEINLGPLCEHLVWTIRGTRGEAMRSLSPERRQEEVIAATRAIVDRIMTSYLELKQKRIWCDKSVNNLWQLEALDAVFPEARFILLHRDSLDFVHSCLEGGHLGVMQPLARYVVQHPTNFVAAMMSAWVDNTAQLLAVEQREPDRRIRIRYEDLVTAPEESLRRLLDFIGVDWQEDLLASVFSAHHDQGGGDPKILVTSRIDPSRVGCGQRIDPALIPEPTRAAADSLCARLSYPPLAAGRRLPWSAVAGGAAEVDGEGERGRPLTDYLQERLRLRAQLAETIRGSCRLVLHGPGGGSWKLDFTGAPPLVAPDEGPADCTLVATVADFAEVIAGRLNPVVALRAGRLSVTGNREIAQAVGKMIYQ